jgi:hypothetical protein
MKSWVLSRLIDDHARLHLLWSVRLQLFWAAFSGLYVALPAFQDYVPPVQFALLCIGMSVAILIARVTKQSKD